MVTTPSSRMGIYTKEKITCRIKIVNAEGERREAGALVSVAYP